MALRRIGSEDSLLLVIDTEELTLTIKGRPVHPIAQGLGVIPDGGELQGQYCATLDVTGNYTKVMCYDPLVVGHLREYVPGTLQYACFYEQTGYQLVIENKSDRELSFFHVNPSLRNAVSAVGTSRRVQSGVINFRNEVGMSTFEIQANGALLVQVTLEVFPSKLDYRQDYFRLVHEVNTEVYNLAFDFLRKTYLKTKLNSQHQSSLTEFYSIISFIFDRLLKAFYRVKTSPHHRIITTHEVVRFDKARRSDHASKKWLLRKLSVLKPCSPHGIKVGKEHYLPEKMLDVRKRVTYDTYENRVLKWMLSRVLDRLWALKRSLIQVQQDQTDAITMENLDRMMQAVRAMLGAEFLNEAGQLTSLDGQSLVLQMAPGYREVYRYYLMLSKGLTIQGSIFKLSMKDVAELYEYWCFLALGRILRKKYNLERQDAIVVRGCGIAVTLDTTRRANLRFINPQTGETYVLSFNARQLHLPTVAQRPDNILTLQKEGSNAKYRYVFDAKYRVDPALAGTPYSKAYEAPGPQEDDINTMHRYRDALVYSVKGDYRRNTFGAIILFPYADEARYAGETDGRAHRFYQSIEKVGIGGLPFLPGHTRLVEDLLEKLIVATPDTAHEQAGEPIDTEQYYRERFEQRNVLVGVVKSPLHLAFHLYCRTYHIPLRQLPKGFSHIQKVALYEPESVSPNLNGIGYVAQVKSATIVLRKTLTEIPKDSNEQYVLFTLGPWESLSQRITPAGYGVRSCIYTTSYLLNRACRLPELSLRSDEEIRLWTEIRRLATTLSVIPSDKNLDPETRIEYFMLSGVSLTRKGNTIFLNNGEELSVQDLKWRPMHAFYLLNSLCGNTV